VVVDVDSLFAELEPLGAKGIKTQGRIKVSDRAHLVFDFHKSLDAIQVRRLRARVSSVVSCDGRRIG
jgi:adenylosuccinate synthase